MPTTHPASAREAYDAAADVYDDFTAHHDYDGWTAVIERLAAEHGLVGTRLLDVGCGTGKSFLPFLDRGYRVVACDISPRMLRHARAKSRGRARLLEADVRDLPRLGEFDLVLALDDVVNYVTAGELPGAFRGLARNLAPTGVLVFDANTELTYRTFFATVERQERGGRVLVWRGEVVAGDFRAGGTARATLEAGPRVTSRHVQHHHPPDVVREALEGAGLRCAAILGMGLDGALSARLDEAVHTKALFVGTRRRPPAPAGSRRSRGRTRASGRASRADGRP
jgi:SAM-dependent methyltransferase